MLQTLREFVRRQPAIVVVAALLALGGFAFFLNIIEDVLTGDSGPVDKLLLVRAHRLAASPDGGWLTPLAKGASWLGNWQALVPLGFALMILAWRRRIDWRPFQFYVLSCAGCAVLVLGFKYLIARPRPQIVPPLENAPFLSFPSGHAAYALVGWGFAAYLIARRPHTPLWLRALLALAVAAVAGMVGASRIYLAAHYPSDVAGGLLIGVPWLIIILLGFERRGGRTGVGTRAEPGGEAHVRVS
jgi:undecaprenyl-diphosphatase